MTTNVINYEQHINTHVLIRISYRTLITHYCLLLVFQSTINKSIKVVMEFRILDITLISCENLTCPYTRKPIKKNALGIIKLPHINEVRSTTLDKENGSYPHWNEKFRVEIPISARWFDVEIRHGTKNNVLGIAKVPVSDFVNCIVPAGYLNCLSYRLRGRNGEFVSGIVNMSVRVTYRRRECCGDKISLGRPVVQELGGVGKPNKDGGSLSGSGYGYEVWDRGVVTGIPVSYDVKI
ncbi:hypothetical protein QQ045_005322 [Rhodiola kirilowii]